MPSKPKSSSALAVQSAHHSEAFKDIPELFESSYEESLMVRTEALSTPRAMHNHPSNNVDTFKQLGPADLVHVTKTIPNSRQQVKEVIIAQIANGRLCARCPAITGSWARTRHQPRPWPLTSTA